MTFEWKDYAGGNKNRILTLDAVEFIRRFLLHILPGGFVRIRQFGFLANRARRKKLGLCRALISAQPGSADTAIITSRDASAEEQDRRPCPVCRTGHMIRIVVTQPARFAVPLPRQDSS